MKYPATVMVHTPTGPIPCCNCHEEAARNLYSILGCAIAATELEEPAECTNCVNEAKHAVEKAC